MPTQNWSVPYFFNYSFEYRTILEGLQNCRLSAYLGGNPLSVYFCWNFGYQGQCSLSQISLGWVKSESAMRRRTAAKTRRSSRLPRRTPTNSPSPLIQHRLKRRSSNDIGSLLFLSVRYRNVGLIQLSTNSFFKSIQDLLVRVGNTVASVPGFYELL